MARTYLPASEQERDDLWLDLIESGVEDTASIADKTGFTRRRIQQRVKAAKERREADGDALPREHDTTELPYVQLVHDPLAVGFHYRLDADEQSRLPLGPFRIGDHNGRRLQVKHAGDGKPVEAPAKSKAKFKPKQPRRKSG